MIKKTLISAVLVISMLFATTSCDKYLDVNKNVDAPDYVEGYLYLAGIIQAYQGMYWDIRALGPLTQMMGSASWTPFATHYYYLGSDAAGEIFRTVYWLQGMNLENLINQSISEGHWTMAGIGLAIKAYSWDQMTKYHAELPAKQAYVPGLLSFDYDYQNEIYDMVREWAYKAIEYLEKDDPTGYGTRISANDFIYGGQKPQWIKFAYGVIVRNLASLTNKSNFNTAYAQELITAAGRSLQTTADDATVKIAGGSDAAAFSGYNNFWGTFRRNLSLSYHQHDFAVQVFTGTVPKYDESTGDKLPATVTNPYYPYELADQQIITDTVKTVAGHFDPRVAVKLSTIHDPNFEYIDVVDSIKTRRYYGGTFTGRTGPIGTAPSYYGRNVASAYSGATHDGRGKWLYRDDAPYILMTAAEIKFCLAEAYWKLGEKMNAYNAFRDGVKEDLAFTAKYISAGTKGSPTGGDKITTAVFNQLASQYSAGPYVDALPFADFSLSHIMMQKWVALYPWGAQEAWVDMRKYHYDIAYTGEYPTNGNGWSQTQVDQKWDSNASKVYKGLYLGPAQVQHRKSSYNVLNEGAPTYRVRPRFNSEYMWNKPALESLKPISGMAVNYHTSIPWFAYPGNIPGLN